MIVRNEAAVVRRCLASVKHLIDYWVIIDTGSDDGTQQIIREFLQEIPGELHERPWIDFLVTAMKCYRSVKGRRIFFY